MIPSTSNSSAFACWEALDVLLTEAIAALQPGADTSPSLTSVRWQVTV